MNDEGWKISYLKEYLGVLLTLPYLLRYSKFPCSTFDIQKKKQLLAESYPPEGGGLNLKQEQLTT
jgi:hypothetical protein